MKIGINASFVRKPDSGTGQVTKHFLGALFSLAKNNPEAFRDKEFTLYFEEEPGLDLPSSFSQKIFSPPYGRDDLIRKIWWEKFLLPKKVEEDGCDVLFSVYQSPTVTEKAQHIMLVHDVVWKRFPQYLNNLRKKIYYSQTDKAIKKADQIMTVSEFSKKDIEKFCGVEEDKITVNYDDCDPLFKKEYLEEEMLNILEKHKLQRGYIFYVGGFDVRKNLSALISAYGKMWKEHHEYTAIPKLVLAGKFHPHLVPLVTDIPECIRKASKEHGVPEENIELMGFAEQEELPLLYRGAAMLCYPSLHEGFGLPVLEAMNSGCAVVASKTSSIPEVVGDDGAWLVDPQDEKELSEAMFEAFTNMEKRNRFIENAKRQAEKFSWEEFAKKFISLLHEITK